MKKDRRRKQRKVLSIILGVEILAAVTVFLIIILRGDISFHMVGAKEALNEVEQDTGTASEEEGPVDQTGSGSDKPLDASVAAGDGGTTGGTTKPFDSVAGGTEQETEAGSSEASTLPDSSQVSEDEEDKEAVQDVYDTITISVAGDVTLGRDYNYGYTNSFDHEFEVQNKDYGYFFRNVKEIFEKDDLTIVNLETTLTTAKKPADKKFRFKADPSYVEILKQGDIEVVSIANNHTRDYLEQGYTDTLATLEEAGVGYFGYKRTYIQEIRGIKIGLAGLVTWDATEANKKEISQRIEELRQNGADIVIVMFHWGIERDYYPNDVQKELAHYSIDCGADLVLGGHPHVLQGVEEYNGKQIVYSLGNFSFGGNKNPGDKDSMVYVHRFHFKNGSKVSEEKEIIPCSISSVKDRNNYQPTPLTGSEKQRVLDKIEGYSKF